MASGGGAGAPAQGRPAAGQGDGARRAVRIRVRRPGGYGRLEIEAHDVPPPGPAEVRVAVEAAGVNFADCLVRMGLYASARELVGWPVTPGFDVAGRVDAVGSGVAGLAPGTPVVGVTRFGGYASAVCVPHEQVFERPAGLSAVAAAALPTAYLTAWYASRRLAAVEPGHLVLVHSAAGGVGSALVALCRLSGARVVGVVGGAHKREAATAAGAEVVVDRLTEDLTGASAALAPAGYDAVFDANGGRSLRWSFEHLAPEGRLVVYGFHRLVRTRLGLPNPLRLALEWIRTPRFDPLRMTAGNRSVLACNLSYLFDRRPLLRRAMGEILAAFAAGRLAPPPIETFPLERAADAQRALESGRTVGKLVLLPRPE